MSVPKCNQRAVNKYMKNHYDSIRILVPKGRKKDIEAYAIARGESVNASIGRLVREALCMDADTWRAADVQHEPAPADPAADV